VLDQLDAFGGVTVRRMFGGQGLFRDGIMIALIASDTLYFKVDDRNSGDFEQAGMEPFGYDTSGGRRSLASYYQVPLDILEDTEKLVTWAGRAWEAALAAQKCTRPKKRP